MYILQICITFIQGIFFPGDYLVKYIQNCIKAPK